MNPFLSEIEMPCNEEMMTITMEFEKSKNTADGRNSPHSRSRIHETTYLYDLRERIYMILVKVRHSLVHHH